MGDEILPEAVGDGVDELATLVKPAALLEALWMEAIALKSAVLAMEDGDAPEGGQHSPRGIGIDQGAEVVGVDDVGPQPVQGEGEPPAGPPIPAGSAAECLHRDAGPQASGECTCLFQAKEGGACSGIGEAIGEVHDPVFHAAGLQGEHDLGDLQGGGG